MTVGQLQRILSYLPSDAEAVLAIAGDEAEVRYAQVASVSLVQMHPIVGTDDTTSSFVRADPQAERSQVQAAVISEQRIQLSARDADDEDSPSAATEWDSFS